MENQKIVVIAEKVKAYAIALIGIVFFSWGTNYIFGEHLLYNVPRVLLPVFNLFGPIGLAIGLLLLGGALIVYGFVRWKKVAAKSSIYWIVAGLGLAVGITLANVHTKSKSSEDFMKEYDRQREAQIDEIRRSDKPDFKNQDLEKHFADFDNLYKNYKKAVQDKDTEAIIKCEDAYTEWVGKLSDFIPQLNNDEKYELSRYNAKLAILWNDLQMKAREEKSR